MEEMVRFPKEWWYEGWSPVYHVRDPVQERFGGEESSFEPLQRPLYLLKRPLGNPSPFQRSRFSALWRGRQRVREAVRETVGFSQGVGETATPLGIWKVTRGLA